MVADAVGSDSSGEEEEKTESNPTPSRPRPSKKPKVVEDPPEASPPAKKDAVEASQSPGSIGDQLYIVDCILGRKKDARVRSRRLLIAAFDLLRHDMTWLFSKGKYVYLVRWQGYTDKDNSWVTREVRSDLWFQVECNGFLKCCYF